MFPVPSINSTTVVYNRQLPLEAILEKGPKIPRGDCNNFLYEGRGRLLIPHFMFWKIGKEFQLASDDFKKPSRRFQLIAFSNLNILIRIQYFFQFLSAAFVQCYTMHDSIFLTSSKSVSKWLCTPRYKQSNLQMFKVSQVLKKDPGVYVILLYCFLILSS